MHVLFEIHSIFSNSIYNLSTNPYFINKHKINLNRKNLFFKLNSRMRVDSRNRNEPILTSISFSVDNRSTPAPPSYEYVIKHPVITQSENQPPSYESLYDRMRNAHRTIRNTVRNGTIDHSSGII